MANESDAPKLFNPLLWWADLGMRATDAAVTSIQGITDGADRVTRAVAGAEPDDIAAAATRVPGGPRRPVPAAGLQGIASMQRVAWELMTRQWTLWLANIGNVMAAGSGARLARPLPGQDNPLEAVRDNLRPLAWSQGSAADSAVRSQARTAARLSSRPGAGAAQHAMAAGESKPRRKTAAKSRKAPRSSRK